MTLLAFPRGRWRGSMYEGERLRSAETRRGWRLRVSGKRRRRYALEAGLSALRRRFVPAAVRVAGRKLPQRAWSYNAWSGVLRARFRARRATVVVR
jgi:hypothetical protein